MKAWLFILRRSTMVDAAVAYDTKDAALNALREMVRNDSPSASRIKGIYEVNLELKTIQEYTLTLENMMLTLKKKG
ncbi:hypothetical protein [Paenibacillus larvae]|uniref:Uncharacterized protein n=1 Tax=Paenibacillus larvae subsp. larvae TaxID=147375 RepID=A0A6C0QZB1_9BACL|nr:hypothetical protein [Paenibacillus larvae]QHZ54039.1 hypothetical protein ERICV_05055 [Paenibacillus larvae subsp. larvae]